MRRAGAFLVACTLSAPLVTAQQAGTLRVTVTSVSGRSVFVDHGRGAGLTLGQDVRFFPPGASHVDGVVRTVSSSSARVEIAPGLPLPPVGTQGEVEVPEQQEPAPTPPGGVAVEPRVPEHPPWSRRESARTDELPLLAPAFGRRPDERPMQIHGHVFGQLDYSHDRGAGRRSDYFVGRLGTRFVATNPVGLGGRLAFDGEVNRRAVDLLGSGAEADDRGRVDVLSYAIGGEEYAGYRLEMGRFQSVHVPELGLLDGVEGVLQFQNGWKAGAGVGAYPRPFPARASGEDATLHVFVEYQSTEPHNLSGVLAFQQTWHEGAPDRDLLFGRVNVRPGDDLWLFGSFKLDFYTSSDLIEGSGAELTQLWAQARYAPAGGAGAALSFSHYSWPDLKRREFQTLPPELVRNGGVDRLSFSSWMRPGQDLRLTGRIDYWEDHERDGLGGELGSHWSDVLGSGLNLFGSVFYAEGSYTDGPGFRLRARRNFGATQAWLGYEWNRWEARGLLLSGEEFTRQTIRGGLDWGDDRWQLSVSGDYMFGDGEDAFILGVYVQYHF